ncbi:FAD-dependent oxidoreductase (plasmid) [Streptomyces sp. NBC_00335]|uniref:FAD-dependent oxidoreductase n=1 Tax=unclassified Streptomyces TaxID=2593676 RepID=UPI002258237F|nr:MULTISPECIES: FAD-dependent oxidoreductase [unclassified Streptomyces]MCX5410083.1 FAD-dependent oxidoreductase [Streptomyces sp. NBC_00086]
MANITIIGGGLAGLAAAITAAEKGARVTVHEAHSHLGGRARSASAPYVTNDGPHTIMDNGPVWHWLLQRGLAGRYVRLSFHEWTRMRFRHQGKLRMTLPSGYMKMCWLHRDIEVPVDRSFQDWASERFDQQTVNEALGFLGPILFDGDPGRLSAAFVWERLLRVGTPRFPLPSRYFIGGWGTVVERMERVAKRHGVVIETGSRITELPTDGPVIVATSLASARSLLGDSSLDWPSGTSALLDMAVTRSKKDGNVSFDMDEGGFTSQYSDHDPSLAPKGEALFQGAMPLRPGESKGEALARLEKLFDLTTPGWRDRILWRREGVSRGRTGALDLPGLSWRDRPAVDRGDGVYLIGDAVAAPGILAETSINSAVHAAGLAVGAKPVTRRTAVAGSLR